MAVRNFSSTAVPTTLTSSVNSTATSLAVGETTGYPTAPFVIVLNKDLSTEEAVLVGDVVGLNFNSCTRGYDSTTAVAHDAGATVHHAFIALDAREANTHVNADSPTAVNPVHGAESAIVAVDDTQVLDNKTFQHATSTGAAAVFKGASGQSDRMVEFQDSGATVGGGIYPTGRIDTPGITGTDESTFEAGDASTVPCTVKGAASQTAHLISATDSSDTEVLGVDADGRVVTPGVDGSDSSTFSAGSTATIPLIAKGASGQTGDLFQAQDSTGTAQATIGPSGQITAAGVSASGNVSTTATVSGATVASSGAVTAAGGATITGATSMTSASASAVPLRVDGAAGQTANLQEWRNSGGTVQASVSDTGEGVFSNLPARVASGTTVTSTNSNGDCTIATGLTSITMFVGWSGDSSVGNVTLANNRGLWPSTSSTDVGVRFWDADSGAVLGSTTVRVDWIAIGS